MLVHPGGLSARCITDTHRRLAGGTPEASSAIASPPLTPGVTATHTGAVPTPHARCVRDTHRRCLLATTSRLERDGQRPIVQSLHAGGALEVLSAISRSAQPLTPGVPDSDSTSYARCVCDTHRRHMLTAPWGLERDRASTSNIKCVCDTHRRHTRAAPLRSGA